ncbi:hypothetical protein [Salinigranum sp.]|uniref:DUF7573 domain-containing protein n=1 Tax=Salinigranum sp. TaxID=1966351 RepID=UPI00356ADAB9
MGENRSLDEFFPASDDADDEAVDAAADDDTDTDRTAPGGTDGDDTDRDRAERAEADADSPAGDTAATGEAAAGSDANGVEDGEAPAHVDESDGPADEADRTRATYRWSPDGDDCPVCGETADRQWRDGDRFVCADCKEW